MLEDDEGEVAVAENPQELEDLMTCLTSSKVDSSEINRRAREFLAKKESLDLKIHPYGFAHTTLGQSEDGRAVRMHVWMDDHEMRDLPTRVHAHAWDARSYILLGRLFNEEYSVTPKPDGSFRLFSVTYRGQSSVRVPTSGRVDVKLSDSKEHTAGHTYEITLGVYHQTVVPQGEFTTTLFVTEPKESTPSVVGLDGEEEEEAFERASLPEDISASVRSRILANL